jgi:hypothetical protein
LVLLSALWFGWATWHDFLTIALGSPSTYESGRIDFAGFVSLFGAIRLLGGNAAAAYAGQGVVTLAGALLVAFVWRRGLSLPVRAAALAAATVAAIPVVLLYDLMVVAIAGAWLIRAGRETGFLPWEKITLTGLFIVPLLARNIGAAWHVPLGSLTPLLLLALVLARARQELSPQIFVAPFLSVPRPAQR